VSVSSEIIDSIKKDERPWFIPALLAVPSLGAGIIKLNLWLAISIAVAVLIVTVLVTMALGRFKDWIILIIQRMSTFVLFPLSVVLRILLV